ncbi:hypothetical protein GCM10009680_23620 [Streptomyces yatensis]|uniref:Apea-like HEPN domain-containing protein n=2 Tax=Streptomyces yatensis TaxID=155177 RepID=A0ABN2H7M5_9ACTN
MLNGILENDLQGVYRAKTVLGEDTSTFPENVRDRINASASLSRRDREELCLRLVEAKPRKAHHIVWLTYTSALINREVITAGPVTLYDGPKLRDMPQDAAIFPQELKQTDERNIRRIFPSGERFVMARVDLGLSALSDAPALARKQALAVITAGSTHASGKKGSWKESGGFVHVMDGRIVSQTITRSGNSPITRFQLDPLAHGIDKAAKRISTYLPLTSQSLVELLDSVNLWDRAQGYDGTSSVLTNVRLIELLASNRVEDWTHFCHRVFEHHWTWSDLQWGLRQGIDRAARGSSEFISEETQAAIDEIYGRIFEDKDGLAYSDMELALKYLPDLAQHFSENELIGYRLKSLERDYSTCARLNASRKLLTSRWNRALARLERVRNALTHGGPVTEASLDSVSSFSRKLAGSLISYALDGVLDGKSVEETMTEAQKLGEEWHANTLTATSPHSFLFGK